MKLYLLALILVVAAFTAGCGSSGTASLSTDDVAVVGTVQVTKAAFNDEMHQAQLSLKSENQAIPKPGTTSYTALRNNVMAVVVQHAEFDQQASKLGVAPTDTDVDKQLTQIKKQYFGGSQAKYLASVKQQGFTDAEVREEIKDQLTQQNLVTKVTATYKPTAAAIQKYYNANIDQFIVHQRNVEEILVGKKKQSLANQIYSQLKGGASFAALAKKYSQDPGSKNLGGKFTAKKGQDVPEFDAAVFAASAKPNVLLKPVNTSQYGWFVIEPLGPITVASKQSVKQATATITSDLKQQNTNSIMTKWVTGIARSYCQGQIKYQAGYKPNPDPCATLTTTTPTTT
jgi:parvulin-like peptidyl-prolyl isomerase